MIRRRAPGYMTEDLELQVTGGPARYTSRTGGPVDHVLLRTSEGEVMGYIYVNDDDDAAGWQPQAGASPEAQNHAALWMITLRECKQRGLKPRAALDEILGTTHPGSYVVAGSLGRSESLGALQELAGRQEPPE